MKKTKNHMNRYFVTVNATGHRQEKGIQLMYDILHPFDRLLVKTELFINDLVPFITAKYLMEHDIDPNLAQVGCTTTEERAEHKGDTYFLNIYSNSYDELVSVTVTPVRGEANIVFEPDGEEVKP